ncbi:hypothetical protein OHA59_23035 [Streptomyces sp. NBC_01589]|uniref:hypothetical protein n=1 Tax=Streptomyces sp. NBC_01589 TaxID=2975886 RepID=UPI003867446B
MTSIDAAGIVDFVLAGRRTLPRDPLAPLLLARRVLRHSTSLGGFRGEKAAALLTGVAAHAMGRLPSIASAAVAMLLGHLAHGSGWPLPRGGSARIAGAMAVDITAHGGLFHTGSPVTDLRQLRHARTVFLDTSPKTFLAPAASRLPSTAGTSACSPTVP